MASSKIVSRLSSRLLALAFNSNKKSLVSELSPVKLTSTRISRVSRKLEDWTTVKLRVFIRHSFLSFLEYFMNQICRTRKSKFPICLPECKVEKILVS